MANNEQQMTFEFEQKKTIKGYPELHWTGKRPFKSTVYYPAQLKRSMARVICSMMKGYGINWLNKSFGATICKS